MLTSHCVGCAGYQGTPDNAHVCYDTVCPPPLPVCQGACLSQYMSSVCLSISVFCLSPYFVYIYGVYLHPRHNITVASSTWLVLTLTMRCCVCACVCICVVLRTLCWRTEPHGSAACAATSATTPTCRTTPSTRTWSCGRPMAKILLPRVMFYVTLRVEYRVTTLLKEWNITCHCSVIS